MRCRLAQKDISEYLDGTLEAGRSEALRAHLERCDSCRSFLEDLREISGRAQRFAPLDPPDRVWENIRSALRERKAAPTGAERLSPAFSRPRFAVRFALASAAVLVVVGGLVLFQPWKSGVAPLDLDAEKAALNRKTLDKLNEAEWHYQEAVKALRQAIESQEGALDPQMAAVFAANLGIVEASIEACRRAVESDPKDLKARNALLAAYGKKVQILTEWASAAETTGAESRPSAAL